MIYGKISTSFELLTEETAIKWKMPYGTLTKAAANLAGSAVEVASGNMALNTSYSGSELTGILFDSYTSDIDDSQGSGFLTVVLGKHVGRTSQIATDVTAATTAGTAIYLGTGGKLQTSSNGTLVGYALSCDGTYLTYYWVL